MGDPTQWNRIISCLDLRIQRIGFGNRYIQLMEFVYPVTSGRSACIGRHWNKVESRSLGPLAEMPTDGLFTLSVSLGHLACYLARVVKGWKS